MSKPFSDTPTAALLALRPAPWRYERAKGEQPTAWQGRPVFNVYDAEGYWIGRVADETEERAEAAARLVVASPLLLAELRRQRIAVEHERAKIDPSAVMRLARLDERLRRIDLAIAAVTGEG